MNQQRPNAFCKGLPARSRACRLRTLYHYINLPKHILNALVGPQHPIWMRLAVGGLIMFGSSYITEGYRIELVIRDLFHAIGAVPWLEYFIAIGREEQQQDDQNNFNNNH